MARRGQNDQRSEKDDQGDLEEVVRESVTDARREIFSAYIRAREAGVLIADDAVPPTAAAEQPPALPAEQS